jgi:glutamate-1-semialdehyde 2,1-aminomutase
MNILDRANESIAQGCLTNSKNPKSLMFGLYPTHIKAAHKAHVWDTNDVRWLDFMCGLGCNFLGYGNDRVSRAIIKYVFNGASHSLPTVHEVETAERLKEFFPFVDKFKFTKTGSLACDAAVRIARAYTGRSMVLSEGYHGHGDDFVSMTPPATGVPARDWMASLESDYDLTNVAAVIIEPVIVEDDRARIEWLKELRRRCTEKGVVLIFDEVITGFRYRKFGVCNAWNIRPDLICLGKAIANGMPLAAVGGRRELMDGEYFISSTYAGDILSLAACRAVLYELHSNHDYDLQHLWRMGQNWLDAFNDNPSSVRIRGYPTRGVFEGDPTEIGMFMQELGRANVLFCKSWFFNWHLAEHTDSVMPLIKDTLYRVAEGKVALKYPLPVAPYAAKLREKKQ